MAFLSISTMLASFMATLLCFRIPQQSLAQPYFYNPFEILKYIAFIGCDTSIIFCIERPIHEMRKAPGDCPGASFFALYQRISPLHTHLCSLGDEPRGGASLGASLAVQVLQHAPGEADVNAHRRHIHIGRIGKRPRIRPQALFAPRPTCSSVEGGEAHGFPDGDKRRPEP